VTLGSDLAGTLGGTRENDPSEIGRRLLHHIRHRAVRPRFAVVHSFSTHNLLLRYWLASNGIDPDKDIELSVVPPADMVDAMAAGQIDGFCAGAPWSAVAAGEGVGRTIVNSSDIWQNHPEKCLAVSARWAIENPDLLEATMDALLLAAQFCDAPENAEEIAEMVAGEAYLALDPTLVRASLPADPAASAREAVVQEAGRSAFFAHAANFPWRSHAAWFLEQMARWNYLPPKADRRALAENVYRPDLYRLAAARSGLSAPIADAKTEGAHAEPWQADGDLGVIPMLPDQFCDGAIFE